METVKDRKVFKNITQNKIYSNKCTVEWNKHDWEEDDRY